MTKWLGMGGGWERENVHELKQEKLKCTHG